MIDDQLDLPVDEPGDDADESESPDLVVPGNRGPSAMTTMKATAQEKLPPLVLPDKVAAVVAAARVAVRFPEVPRPRAIHLGTKGLDVVAVKRALSRAGWMDWGPFTALFGDAAVKALKSFQHHHGILASGAYGVQSHIALVHSSADASGHLGEWAFDDYSIFLMREEAALLAGTPEERIRKSMLACGYFLYTHRDQIPYVQSRPFPLKRPPFVPTAGIDCSAFYTLCSFAGGAPDPNGRGYDGQGYTGTLMSRGRRCSQAELKPGDAVFYGFTTNPSPAFPYGSPTHVAMYVGGGMVLSNGSHPMGHYPVNYRTVNHYRTYEIGGL